MPAPVVHFEIIGTDPAILTEFYRNLFGWEGTVSPTSDQISDDGAYRMIDPIPVPDAPGVAGGIGGGPERKPHLLFYVGVENVEETMKAAERLGATRHLGPATNPQGTLVVGQFLDPEGNLVGVAGPAS